MRLQNDFELFWFVYVDDANENAFGMHVLLIYLDTSNCIKFGNKFGREHEMQ